MALYYMGQTIEFRDENREITERGIAKRMNGHRVEFLVAGTSYAAPNSLSHKQFGDGEAVEVKFGLQVMAIYDFAGKEFGKKKRLREYERSRRIIYAHSLESEAA